MCTATEVCAEEQIATGQEAGFCEVKHKEDKQIKPATGEHICQSAPLSEECTLRGVECIPSQVFKDDVQFWENYMSGHANECVKKYLVLAKLDIKL